MRRRKVKGAMERLLSYEKYVFAGNDFNPAVLKEKSAGKSAGKSDISIELGMGRGKFIIENAIRNPDKFYVGIEVKEEVLLRAAENPLMEKIDNLIFVLGNVDLINEYFEDGTVDHIYINFCDPWPKNRWAKRRLTSKNYLKLYDRILKDKGSLHFKTDSEPLFEFSLNEILEFGYDVRNVRLNLHESEEDVITTEYEEKFIKNNLKIYRLDSIKK